MCNFDVRGDSHTRDRLTPHRTLLENTTIEMFPEMFDVVIRKTISPLISFVLVELINFESSHNYYNLLQTICWS